MLEKIIKLENISLVDFLGVENHNIKVLSAHFPNSKILSRGNEIKLQGTANQILRISELIQILIDYYHKFGKVTEEHVKSLLLDEVAVVTEGTVEKVIVHGVRGNRIAPKTKNQLALVQAIEKNDLVFAIGPAGTGKTYISVALAVRALKNKEIKKIIITRPAVEAGESLGFLPGDLKEKIDPYLRPIYDALSDMIPSEKLKYFQENGIVEIAPLAYMRGRTLNDAYVLLDEAQNTTSMQIKMFLTRMGPSSKMIITGDRSQIDLPKKQKSGLVEAIDVLKDLEGIAMVELDGRDVVRHKLVRSIIKAYDKYNSK